MTLDESSHAAERQLSLELGAQGMQRALEAADIPPWPELAWAWIEQLPRGFEFTSEDMTDAVGKPRPSETHRNNAVGAITQAAGKRRWTQKTGRHVTSRAPKSHGAEINVWRRL